MNLNLEPLLTERPSPAPQLPTGLEGRPAMGRRGPARLRERSRAWATRGAPRRVATRATAVSPALQPGQGWVGVHGTQPSPPGSCGRTQAQGPRQNGGGQAAGEPGRGHQCSTPLPGDWVLRLPRAPPRLQGGERIFELKSKKKRSNDNDNSAKLMMASWHRK